MSGRGAYYKNLYGSGRGREGRGRNRDIGASGSQGTARGVKRRGQDDNAHGNSEDLVNLLSRLNGKSYLAYRDVQGRWDYQNFYLFVDHVQSDPFAPPSKVRVRVGREVAGFPPDLYSNHVREVALCDFLTRRLHMIAGSHSHGSRSGGNWSAAKGGDIQVDKPGQQVLQRSSIVLSNDGLEARFTIGLPAQGRTILGDWAAEIFRTAVPALTEGLLYSSQEKATLQQFVDCIEDQEDLRCQATKAGLVAFVANGAVLPRASGASDEPMASPSVVTFQSPPNLEQSFNLPHRGEIRGMGVPAGITMIAGGGFHGKSTLLDALAVGCYNHIPGDGREFVVTSNNCVSVQGEDGRSITNVDISPFITNLPGGVSTTSFSTKDASGSTSMAAGVIEALELGADILLFDEDTCATNFLIRDLRMQRLISADPITPLIFKIRAMFEDHGCSSILVIGGCGDYCDVADLVLEMRRYQCYDITEAARIVAKEIPSVVSSHQIRAFGVVSPRALISQSLPSAERKMAVRRRAIIEAGDETLDLLGLVQLVHSSQTRAIASALKFLYSDTADASAISLAKCLERLDHIILTSKMDALMENNKIDGFLARPRILEIGMAINRLRTVSLKY